jgi:cellulose synthase (UDP-forming)
MLVTVLRASWLAIAIAAIFFIVQPVSVETQLAIAVTSIAIVLVLSTLRLGGVWRQVLLAVASALILQMSTGGQR